MYAALSVMILVSAFLFYEGLVNPGTGVLAIAALLIIAHYAREIVELFRQKV